MVLSTHSVLGARVSRLLRTGLLMFGLVALAPIPGASHETTTLGKAFVLRVGQTVTVGGTKLSITVRAIRDTRCPKNVRCSSLGYAMVRLVVIKMPHGAPATIEVILFGSGNRRVHGYVIQLVYLTPYPIARIPIKLKDYRVTLLVRKA